MINSKKNIEKLANRIRKDVAIVNNKTRDSHIGGGYSSVDILAVLYSKIMNISKDNLNDPNRDVFILSKGHIATTMYATLANVGIISHEELNKHLVNGLNFAGHTRKWQTKGVPGIEMSAGSLGHGSCVGCGMAYAKKIQNLSGNVFVLLGDGECNEGSVWESVMFASRFKLNNIIFIVDHNRLQAYGREEDVLNMGNLVDKFKSFGCRAISVDGHDYSALEKVFKEAVSGKYEIPTVIVAETIKGKGVSFMEDRLEWHFKSPDGELLDLALKELE